MAEKLKYKVLGSINITDGQGEVQGQYAVGSVYEFDQELGDSYVADGLAELAEDQNVETPIQEEVPVEESPVPEAPVENTEVPTQEEENATIGLDSAEIEKANYRITGDVALFGETQEIGSVVLIEKNLGAQLVQDGLAEEVEI